MSETETELKWSIDQVSWSKLKTLLPTQKTLLQQNFFFDNKHGRLRDARWALRLRKENDDYFLTAKGPSDSDRFYTTRPEIEVALTSLEANSMKTCSQLSEMPFKPCKFLLEQFGDMKLEIFLSFENQRDVIQWEDHLLELDFSQCHGENRYEIEWETEAEIIEKHSARLEAWLIEHEINFGLSGTGKLSWACEVQRRLKIFDADNLHNLTK